MSSTALSNRRCAVDTHALIWFLTGDPRLSAAAAAMFRAAKRGEIDLLASVIVLAELFYADRKHSLFADVDVVMDTLLATPYLQFVPLTAEDIRGFSRDSAVPEMHDRIIAGLARRLDVPLLTRDPLITRSGLVQVLW